MSVYPWSEDLAQRFTVKSQLDDQPPIRLWQAWEEGGQKLIGLPWHCCPIANDDRRVDGAPIKFKSLVVPRDEDQGRCIQDAKDFLAEGLSGVLKAPTGEGKTVMCLDIIAATGVTTCVVVPKDDLMDQWVERITQLTDLVAGQIGRIKGDICDWKGKPIVLASLRSICKPNRYPPPLYRYFGLLVGDEVHRWGADQMGTVVRLFPARRRLGLSATPERTDGRDLQVAAHVGPIRATKSAMRLKAKVLVFQTDWKCPRNKNTGEQLPHSPGKIALIEKSLYNNSRRNRMICHFTATAYKKGRTTVIFGAHLDHLEQLELSLPRWGVPAGEIGRYYGVTTKAQLLKASQASVILATYLKMGEGTDIPTLDTCVLAGPRSNIAQPVGRILRLSPDKKQPIIADFVDSDSRVLKNYAKSRERVYRSLGADIVYAEIPEHEIAA